MRKIRGKSEFNIAGSRFIYADTIFLERIYDKVYEKTECGCKYPIPLLSKLLDIHKVAGIMGVFIAVVLFTTPLLSQTHFIKDSVYVYNLTTEKLKSCEFVTEDFHVVEFRITESSVKTFIKVDTNTWATFNKKIVTRQEKEGWVIFTDGKKVYLYKKSKKS